jgi:hypothetical protein
MSQELDTTIDEGEEEIAAIREVRHRISEQFGHDPYRLVAYLMELQKEHPEKVLRAPEEGVVSRNATEQSYRSYRKTP